MKRFSNSVFLFVVVLISGCASSNLTGDSYTREEARRPQQVHYAEIMGLRPVVIEGQKSRFGAATGAAVGGVAGSSVGHGKGATIAAIVGAAAGGVLGSHAEEAMTREQGVEITVRYQRNGDIVAIVQEASPSDHFRVGDTVRILKIGGVTRVSR